MLVRGTDTKPVISHCLFQRAASDARYIFRHPCGLHQKFAIYLYEATVKATITMQVFPDIGLCHLIHPVQNALILNSTRWCRT
ncbi:hypothetical protein D3C75_1099030 [compost metagenome]